MIAKYDILTYCQKDNWILDERVENTFTAPLQCRRIYVCVCVIWAVKCIYQNWCSYFRGIVRNKLYYQKGVSTIYDKYTYPVKMTNGS